MMKKYLQNLFGQFRYATVAPSFKIGIEIIVLAIFGCTGADNVDAIRAKLKGLSNVYRKNRTRH